MARQGNLTEITADVDGLDAIGHVADNVIIEVARHEVESRLTGSLVERLLALTDRLDFVNRFEDAMTFVVTGYEMDPRELHQIPEVVTFFRAVHAQWPYWGHFLEKEGDALAVLFGLLCDMEYVLVHGCPTPAFKDAQQIGKVMLDLFSGVNALYAQHRLGEARIEAMSGKIERAVHRMFADA
jgi:hypothetical protein